MQLKVTVTSVLFQPAALGPGVRDPLITGGVLSTFTGPKVRGVALLPALSTQFPVTLTPAAEVSSVSVVLPVGLPGATPEPGLSVQVNVTATSLFVQAPAVYGLPPALAVTESTGGVLSTTTGLERTGPAVSVTVAALLTYLPLAVAVKVSVPSPLTGPQV